MDGKVGRILREGLVGGLIAYVAVVVVLAILNAAQGRSVFYTAAAMGAVLFHGSEAATAFALDPAPILAYNGLHLAGSLGVALLAAVLVYEAEVHRSLWYIGLMVGIGVMIFAVLFFGVVGVEIGAVLDWPTAAVGATTWGGATAGYFLGVHRGLLDGSRQALEA